uniref:TPR_REGION domain-containing protein n=1 Tax=Panagrellus redivivus TaxID=6233 RepID=A0A7E4ZW53_PANRE
MSWHGSEGSYSNDENRDPAIYGDYEDEEFEVISPGNTPSPHDPNSVISRLIAHRQAAAASAANAASGSTSSAVLPRVSDFDFREPASSTSGAASSSDASGILNSPQPDSSIVDYGSASTATAPTEPANVDIATDAVTVYYPESNSLEVTQEPQQQSEQASSNLTPAREPSNVEDAEIDLYAPSTSYEAYGEGSSDVYYRNPYTPEFSPAVSPEPIGDVSIGFSPIGRIEDFEGVPCSSKDVLVPKAIKRRWQDNDGFEEPAAKRASTLEMYRFIKDTEGGNRGKDDAEPTLERDEFVEEAMADNSRHILDSIDETDDVDLGSEESSLESPPPYEEGERITFQAIPRNRDRSACILEQRIRERTMTPRPSPIKEHPVIGYQLFSRASSLAPEARPKSPQFAKPALPMRPSQPRSPSVQKQPITKPKHKNKVISSFVREAVHRAKIMLIQLLGIDHTRQKMCQKMIKNVELNIIEAIRKQKYMKSVEHQIFRKEAASMVYQWVDDLTKYDPKPMSQAMFLKFISEKFIPAKADRLWAIETAVKCSNSNSKIVNYRIRLGKHQTLMGGDTVPLEVKIAYKILLTPKFAEIMSTINMADTVLLKVVDVISDLLLENGGYLLFLGEKRQLEPFVGDAFENSRNFWCSLSNKSEKVEKMAFEMMDMMTNWPQLESFGKEMLSRINGLRLLNLVAPEEILDASFEADFNAYFPRPSRRADWVKAVIKNVIKPKVVQDVWNQMPIEEVIRFRPVFFEWLFRWALIAPEIFVFFDPYTAFNANSVYSEQLLKGNKFTQQNQVWKSTVLLNHYKSKVCSIKMPEVVNLMESVHNFIMDNRQSYTKVKGIFLRLHSYPKHLRISLASFVNFNARPFPAKDVISLNDMIPLVRRIFNHVSYPCVEHRFNIIVDNPNPRPAALQAKYEKLVHRISNTVYDFINTLNLTERSYFVLTHPLLNSDYLAEIKDKVHETAFGDCDVSDLFELNSYMYKLKASRTMKTDFWNSCKNERTNVINKVRVPAKEFNDLATNEKRFEASIRGLFAKHYIQIGRGRRNIPDEVNLFIYAAIFAKHASCGDYEGFLDALYVELELHERILESEECYLDLDLFKDAMESVLLKVQDELIERWQFSGLKLPYPNIPTIKPPGTSKNLLAKYLVLNAAMMHQYHEDMQKIVNQLREISQSQWKVLLTSMLNRAHQALKIIHENLDIDIIDSQLSFVGVPPDVGADWPKIYINIKCLFGIQNTILLNNIVLWYYNWIRIPKAADAMIQVMRIVRERFELRDCFGYADDYILDMFKDRLMMPNEKEVVGFSEDATRMQFLDYDINVESVDSDIEDYYGENDPASVYSSVSDVEPDLCDFEVQFKPYMNFHQLNNDLPDLQQPYFETGRPHFFHDPNIYPRRRDGHPQDIAFRCNLFVASMLYEKSKRLVHYENYVKLFALFQNVMQAGLPDLKQMKTPGRFEMSLKI